MAVTHLSDLAGVIWTAGMTVSRQLTSSVTGLAGFAVSFDSELIHLSGYARASGGTAPTLSLAVKSGAATLGSVAVTAGAAATSQPSKPVSQGETLTIDATVGGVSPSWDDITLLLTFRRTD